MSVDFQVQTIKFPNVTGSAQTNATNPLTFIFPTNIIGETVGDRTVFKAEACIKGFDVFYAPFDDHNLGELQIQIKNIDVQLNVVKVTVQYLLRDWSDNIDDSYGGSIDVLVIVDRQ